MNKAELEFRRELCERMAGKWTPTIHVENHLNPGVPDMSFVMSALNCETGWLELKVSDGTRVKVEPGQHAWMRAHAERIPAHFLIKVDQMLFLVRGRSHHIFADPNYNRGVKIMCSGILSMARNGQISLPRFDK